MQPGQSEEYDKLVAQLQELQNRVSTLESEKSNLIQAQEYRPGDSVYLGNITVSGFLTSSRDLSWWFYMVRKKYI